MNLGTGRLEPFDAGKSLGQQGNRLIQKNGLVKKGVFFWSDWDETPGSFGIFTYIWFIFMVNVGKYSNLNLFKVIFTDSIPWNRIHHY